MLSPRSLILCRAAWAMAFCLPSFLLAEIRTFTDVSGRTLRAEFVSANGDYVTLRAENGQQHTLKTETLSRADLEYILKRSAQAGPAPAPAPSNANPAAAPATTTSATATTAPEKGSVIVEALIDGNNELRVKQDGIYWVNHGGTRPGRHMGRNEPTIVNGREWQPKWKSARKGEPESSDTERVFGLVPSELDFKLIAVGEQRGGTAIEKRDEIKVEMREKELSVFIPDGQNSSRWYRFELKKRPQ